VLRDVATSLLAQGCRDLIVLNGHGTNRAVSPVLSEVAEHVEATRCWFIQWWELPPVRQLLDKWRIPITHAGAAEALDCALCRPTRDAVETTSPFPSLLQSPPAIRASLPEGHGPGPLQLPKKRRQRLLEAAVRGMADQLQLVKQLRLQPDQQG